MAMNWNIFLAKHRDAIVDEWVYRLKHQVSELYTSRSTEELRMTVTEACDAFHRVITHNDYSRINAFINEITQIRLASGFPLQDVQKAFELYRSIILPLLITDVRKTELYPCLDMINQCLSYTIHRFSDHFQKMLNRYLEDYAGRLERDVKKRTQELEESEKKYKNLVEGISDGYLVTRGELITFVNASFCRMHEYPFNDVVSHSFRTFVAPESWSAVRYAFEEAACDTPDQMMIEYDRLTRDGKLLPTEITIKKGWYRGNEYNLCICRDITQRIHMEKKIRETERMAYIGHVTASLSHEIRNPLSSIKMNLQILEKKKITQGNDKRRLEISVHEVKRLESILQDLLDFAKPLTLNKQQSNLNTIIHSCLDLLETRFREKKIHIKTRLDPMACAILADAAKLEQVMINLLINAVDSVDMNGDISITTRRFVKEGVPMLLIRVTDNGKGISTDDPETLFEPYFTTKSTGVGLGLANTRRIVNAHEGEIKAQALEPYGASFAVTLPIGEQHGQNPCDRRRSAYS